LKLIIEKKKKTRKKKTTDGPLSELPRRIKFEEKNTKIQQISNKKKK